MSTISNRFYVTATEDGTTLHGSMLSTKPLSQTWDGSAALPNWSEPTNNPIVYVVLYDGNSPVTGTQISGSWKYDRNPINWIGDTSTDGKFKTTYHDGHPAIKIIDNLAQDGSNENHYLSFEGTYSGVAFTVSLKINLSVTQNGGYFGLIDFDGGKNYFDSANQTLTLTPHLYAAGGGAEMIGNYSVTWLINATTVGATSGLRSTVDGNKLILEESDVVDNAIITARFKVSGSDGFVYSAYTSVDDLQDPEYMYIQYNKANGQSATLRDREKVKFYAWVGKTNSSSPIASFNKFSVKFLNSAGEVVKENLSGYYLEPVTENVIEGSEDGWRQMAIDIDNEVYSDDKARAHCIISHKLVTYLGKNLTGFILAEQTDQD